MKMTFWMTFGEIIAVNMSSAIQIDPQFLCNSPAFLCFFTAGNIRNLAMEKVAGSVLFPCRYVSNGCNATMPHTDKSTHEDGCEFRWAAYLLC